MSVLPGVTAAMLTRNALARALSREARAYGVGGQLDLARRLGVSPSDVRNAIAQMPTGSARVARALGYVQHPVVDGAYQRRDASKPSPREA